MKVIDGGKLDADTKKALDRARQLVEFINGLWDMDDEDDVYELLFTLTYLFRLAAFNTNPFTALGLLARTVSKLNEEMDMEEDDD